MDDTWVVGIAVISSALSAWAANRWTAGGYLALGQRVTELEKSAQENYSELLRLRAELDQALQSQMRLRNGVNRLIEQLRSLGVHPVWTPDSKDES